MPSCGSASGVGPLTTSTAAEPGTESEPKPMSSRIKVALRPRVLSPDGDPQRLMRAIAFFFCAVLGGMVVRRGMEELGSPSAASL